MRPFKNMTLMLMMALILTLALAGCGSSTTTGTPDSASTAAPSVQTSPAAQDQGDSALKTFTREELKKYNGQDGNPAYVAVDGKVYDLTGSRLWKNGKHNGFEAGNDLTEAIKTKSPHGVAKLEGIPVVGKLAD